MTLRGSSNIMSKLTERDVMEIRDLYASGMFVQKWIAYEYGISQRNVNNIVNNKTWRHV